MTETAGIDEIVEELAAYAGRAEQAVGALRARLGGLLARLGEAGALTGGQEQVRDDLDRVVSALLAFEEESLADLGRSLDQIAR